VPLSLATRIRREVKERAKQKKRITMWDLPSLSKLPLKVQQELCLSLFARTLLSHSVFYTWCLTDEILIQDLTSRALDLSSCCRNDDLFVSLQEAKCIYFLKKGLMRYRREIWSADIAQDKKGERRTRNSTQLKRQRQHEEIALHPEDWASTIAFWCQWNYVGRLSAEETCDLISFAVDRMLRVLEAHPHVMAFSQKYACAYNILANIDDSEHACRADLDITPARVLLAMSVPDRLAFSEPIMHSYTENCLRLDTTIEQFFPARRHKLSHDTEKSLKKELELGKCVVTIGADHQLLRTVVLCALRITNMNGKVLVKVAESNEQGKFSPQVVVPGTKLKEGETTMAAVDRLLQDELPTLLGTLQCDVCEPSETELKSKHGVRTVYLKTLYHMSLQPSEEDLQDPVASMDSELCSFIKRGSCPARSQTPQSPPQNMSFAVPVQGIIQKLEAIPVQREDGRWQVFSWLRDHEFEALQDVEHELLSQWLSEQQEHLGDCMGQPYHV
jgi:hypothetical protein